MSEDKPSWVASFLKRLVTPKRVQTFGMRTVRELLSSAVAALDEEIAKIEAIVVEPQPEDEPEDDDPKLRKRV